MRAERLISVAGRLVRRAKITDEQGMCDQINCLRIEAPTWNRDLLELANNGKVLPKLCRTISNRPVSLGSLLFSSLLAPFPANDDRIRNP